MTPERYCELDASPDVTLTPDEQADGWHFCVEYRDLLTQGEVRDVHGVCICGFIPPRRADRRWYRPTLPELSRAAEKDPALNLGVSGRCVEFRVASKQELTAVFGPYAVHDGLVDFR